MSALTFRPDFNVKHAVIEGVVAAGEKVAVTLKDCAAKNSSNLRLRVMFNGKTLARFPLSDTDHFTVSGADLTCTLNLNTMQMLKLMRRIPELDLWFVLDDPGDSVRQMYFTEYHEINGWPHEIGTDSPIDVNTYRTDIDTLNAEVSALAVHLAQEIERVLVQVQTKVTKVAGKGLSTIDLTTAILNSLATKSELSAHTENSGIHGAATEKANWNAGLAQMEKKQDIIVCDGFIYVPCNYVEGNYNYARVQVVFDPDLGQRTFTLSDKTYIRSNDGTGFVEGT